MKLSSTRGRPATRLRSIFRWMDPLNSLTTAGAATDKPIDIVVRPSTDDDVQAMLAIYEHHIQRGLGELDFEPLHGHDIKRRRKNMAKRRLPHLVAERAGVVIGYALSLIHISEPTRLGMISYAVFCLKKKK